MPTSDQELILKWDAKFDAMRKQRSKFEQQWHLNMAFYFGRQWVVINTKAINNTAGYVLQEPRPKDSWRVRAVRNRIKRAIRNEMTKLTKEEPQGYVLPASSEEEDRMAAIAAEAVAEYHVASSNFKAKRSQATFWTVLCGTGFLKTYYDPVAKTEDGTSGRVMYDGVSAFHIFAPYLHLVDLEEQPYVCHARTVDASLIQTFYDKEIKPTTDSTSIMDQRFMQTLGIHQTTDSTLKQAYIKEWWVKPCREYSDGAMFIYCDKTLLHMNEKPVAPEPDTQMALPTFNHPGLPEPNPAVYPYEHGKFPFQKIDHIPTGMFYAESTIKDLIPVQKDYNRIRSQIIEHRNIATRPQWWMRKGSFNPKEFTSEPGIVIQVNPGGDGPQRVEQPDLPQQISVEIDLNVREFDDISGQFEISKGRTPPGVEAASAIAFLQEENDTILYHTVASIEAAVQESGRQSLSLVHQLWSAERITRIVSRNNELESTLFKDINLAAGMDYRVVSGSMEPRSRAAKQAVISDLMKNNAIPVEKGLKYMYMSETNALFEEMQVDVNHARRENLYMAKGAILRKDTGEVDEQTGEPIYEIGARPVGPPNPMTGQPTESVQYFVTVNKFDNHPVHYEEHARYMKSQQYEVLPPAVKKIFLDHLEEHELKMQEMYAQEQQTEQLEETGQPYGP